ncbi:YggS family pyridoxal phosphate enzyme [candidate division WOR-3 bacterium RBG_13_43_14]|uniref:Pyridoxal phosphate homeostasis protein n=1 Tax=candidate division WOR-3 bacterium RBG_13_43_14 TaxID=1802590 RepID=A0A1F4UB17_UNCW3|nr:MAG: YggS family pyridoxal phosphate enzyme [candidate division WOR-3 bacterium RBG_13_43_14]
MPITENLTQLRKRLNAACQRSGRDPAHIKLIAVSKTFSAAAIEEAIDAGITDIGENRVQEAKEKYALIKKPLRWHLVGHLQTNKVKDAIKIFNVIHGLDSLHLAQEIQKRALDPINCLIEINTSGEKTKFGVEPETALELAKSILNLDKIKLIGLMTIGPGWAIEDPEASRPCFKMLRAIKMDLAQVLGLELSELSMGMTSDFEIAIEESATMIRIGTAIFGSRQK